MKSKQIISAQVILRPPGGGEMPAAENITSENIGRYLPAEKDLKDTQNYFVNIGFDVRTAVGIGFSIVGQASLFEEVFKTKLVETDGGGIESVQGDKPGVIEMPVDHLPGDVKKNVAAVTFSRPPDFGPANF